jgi:hypothetical protein
MAAGGILANCPFEYNKPEWNQKQASIGWLSRAPVTCAPFEFAFQVKCELDV